ncbi:MAG TPA: TonB-dependent receptor, partial [Gemmatimonadales bacterium]
MLVSLLTALVFAQAPQSSIAGVVRDGESGSPLRDAEVSLPDLSRLVLTDSLGRYRFAEVPPGPQHLTVRRIGYSPRTLHAFAPADGLLQIDISLDPVPLRLASLVVRTTAAMRGLESDSTRYPDRGLSMAAMRNDPFLPEPDGLLALRGGEVSSEPESPSGVHVRGSASDQTGYALDGIPVFSPYHTAGIFSAWNPDAIERVQLSSSSPSPAYSPVLAGTITATTRAPGVLLAAQGTLSTSQTRLALDGPLGTGGAGFLLSLRAGYPGLIAPSDDPSYLRGDTRDGLGKLELPLRRGILRLLIYEMGNSMGSAAGNDSVAPLRNDFEWGSRSVGAQWTGPTRWGTVRLQGWSASTEAEATWLGTAPVELTAERQDEGLLALIEQNDGRSSSTAGVRIERSRTGYRSV